MGLSGMISRFMLCLVNHKELKEYISFSSSHELLEYLKSSFSFSRTDIKKDKLRRTQYQKLICDELARRQNAKQT